RVEGEGESDSGTGMDRFDDFDHGRRHDTADRLSPERLGDADRRRRDRTGRAGVDVDANGLRPLHDPAVAVWSTDLQGQSLMKIITRTQAGYNLAEVIIALAVFGGV